MGAGELDEAWSLYRRIAELRRSDIPARYMMGVVRFNRAAPPKRLRSSSRF